MAGLSASSWVILALGCVIFFGGSIYTLLIAAGYNPQKYLEKLGLFRHMDSIGSKAGEIGIYKPFEYMDRGNKEKAQGALVLLILLLVGWWAGVYEEETEASFSSIGGVNYELANETWSASDYTAEGEETEVDDEFDGRVKTARFELTWTDDDTTEGNIGGTGVQNQPDTFRLTIITPNGTEYSEEAASDVNSENGIITIEVLAGMTELEKGNDRIEDFEAGDWEITVECVEAGDSRDNLGVIVFADDGNQWSLAVEYGYYKELKKPGD